MKSIFVARTLAASLFVGVLHAQTTLSVGDLSFISAEGDSNGAVNDGYSIVTWQSLAAGTVLKFTDNGMANAAATAANTSEHVWTFTVGASAIAAGTTLSFGYNSPTASKWNGPASGTTSTNLAGFTNGGISASGDQFFVYQGTGTGANLATTPANAGAFTGTLISGINFGATVTSGPLTNGNESNETYTPTSLVNGDAYVNGGNFDNAYYNGVRTGLSNTLYRAATHNLTNFTFTETLNAIYDRTTSFTIASAASIQWDASGATPGDGGTGTWDTTTNDRFKDNATGSTYFRWVNSTLGNGHTAVFGGTAGTVTVSGGVAADGLTFNTTGYTITGSTITLADFDGAGGSTPTIGIGNSTHTANINSVVAGTGLGPTKTGAGTLVLGGDNTYTGVTNVSAGTLLINGNQSGATGNVSVASGAILGGGGTVGGNTTITGTHAAGNNGIGTQTFSGDLTYASGTSIFSWQLGGNTVGTRGTNYDAVNVGDTLAVNNSVFNIVVTGLDITGTFWDSAQTWDVFNQASTGTFAEFNLFTSTNLATEVDYTAQGSFSFNTGTGNLQWNAVPEPTSALAGILVAAGILKRRRVA